MRLRLDLLIGILVGMFIGGAGVTFAQTDTVSNIFEVAGGPYEFQISVDQDKCVEGVCKFVAEVVDADTDSARLKFSQVVSGTQPTPTPDNTQPTPTPDNTQPTPTPASEIYIPLVVKSGSGGTATPIPSPTPSDGVGTPTPTTEPTTEPDVKIYECYADYNGVNRIHCHGIPSDLDASTFVSNSTTDIAIEFDGEFYSGQLSNYVSDDGILAILSRNVGIPQDEQLELFRSMDDYNDGDPLTGTNHLKIYHSEQYSAVPGEQISDGVFVLLKDPDDPICDYYGGSDEEIEENCEPGYQGN